MICLKNPEILLVLLIGPLLISKNILRVLTNWFGPDQNELDPRFCGFDPPAVYFLLFATYTEELIKEFWPSDNFINGKI